jgi:hypothetical protein
MRILRGFLLLEHRVGGFEFHSRHGVYLRFACFVLYCVWRGFQIGQFFFQEIVLHVYKRIHKSETGRNWTAAVYGTTYVAIIK